MAVERAQFILAPNKRWSPPILCRVASTLLEQGEGDYRWRLYRGDERGPIGGSER
jgi:hypothetical protein